MAPWPFFSNCWKDSSSQEQRNRPPVRRLPPPVYRRVRRERSPLLSACWEQDWTSLVHKLADIQRKQRRQRRPPHELYCVTENGGRTLLHLATMPGANCPEDVLEMILDADPHAVVVSDDHQHSGTPLHFLCGSRHRNNAALVQRFVERAIAVEKQYYNSRDCSNDEHENEQILAHDYHLPVSCSDGYSPLWMACRKNADFHTLRVLLESRKHTKWIAPLSETAAPSPLSQLWNAISTDLVALEPHVLVHLKPRKGNGYRDRDKLCFADRQALEKAQTSWRKMLLLLTELRGTTRAWPILFIVSIQKHPELLRFTCRLFPEQLCLRAWGSLPVHYFLEHYRERRRLDYPFRRARTPFRQDVLDTLVSADKRCLGIKGGEHGLYTAILAAWVDAPLDTVYNLLREAPVVLERQQQEGVLNVDEPSVVPLPLRQFQLA